MIRGAGTMAVYFFGGMAVLTIFAQIPPGVLLVPAAAALYWAGWKIARWVKDRVLERRAKARPEAPPRPEPVPPGPRPRAGPGPEGRPHPWRPWE